MLRPLDSSACLSGHGLETHPGLRKVPRDPAGRGGREGPEPGRRAGRAGGRDGRARPAIQRSARAPVPERTASAMKHQAVQSRAGEL